MRKDLRTGYNSHKCSTDLWFCDNSAARPAPLYGGASCWSNNWEQRCAFLLTDNEILRAEDPHAQ